MPKLKSIGKNILLLFCSLLVALTFSEIVIRVYRPELRDLVDTKFQRHLYRIHSNPKNVRYTRINPDTGENHLVINNSLGFRQHREFSIQKPQGTIRIGFFGDSFTENLRIKAQFSFTEPLDYLLNQAGASVEILNFGTDGYGTDQVYLQYLDESLKFGLDFIVYVYCWNDLMDVLADRLFEVDTDNRLYYVPKKQTTVLVNIVRRFYLTYFVMGILAKYSGGIDDMLSAKYYPETIVDKRTERRNRRKLRGLSILYETEELQKALKIFSQLISSMQKITASKGQKFVVVILPQKRGRKEANAKIKNVIENLGVSAIDLCPLFEDEEQPFSKFFFKNDGHWNEEGNKIAAIHLFKYFAKHFNLDANPNFIRKKLYEYYHSFESGVVTSSWLEPVEISRRQKDNIRKKYLELENQ